MLRILIGKFIGLSQSCFFHLPLDKLLVFTNLLFSQAMREELLDKINRPRFIRFTPHGGFYTFINGY
jgi:hypothetical protein